MAVERSCTSCGQTLRVPDMLASQAVKCPTCGTLCPSGTNGSASPGDGPTYPAPKFDPPPASMEPQGSPDGSFPPGSLETEMEPSRPRLRRDAEPHRGNLILALGVVSQICVIVCAPIGLITGITAWVMGGRDLRKIRSGDMDPAGEGTTLAGKICGIVGFSMSTVLTIFMLLYFGLIAFVLSAMPKMMRAMPPPPPPAATSPAAPEQIGQKPAPEDMPAPEKQ